MFLQKKSPKCFILYYFLVKNICFWHKNPFLIFLAQVRSKWISESCSTAFKGPLCKNLGWVLFFFKLYASGIPVRITQTFVKMASMKIVMDSPSPSRRILYCLTASNVKELQQSSFSLFITET